MGFIRLLGKGLGIGCGVLFSAPVGIAGQLTGFKTFKESARDIYRGTVRSGEVLSQAISGSVDVVQGIVSRDEGKSAKGVEDVGNAFSSVASGLFRGAETVYNGSKNVVTGISKNDPEKIGMGANTLLKAAIVGALAISIADATDIVDIGEE
ncbi:MAG: hypothetical protein ACM3MK_06000 [Chitinophagales bacterium]